MARFGVGGRGVCVCVGEKEAKRQVRVRPLGSAARLLVEAAAWLGIYYNICIIYAVPACIAINSC